MQRFRKFFAYTWRIFRRQKWRVVRIILFAKRDRRTEAVLWIIERRIGWRCSMKKFHWWLLRIRRIQVDGTSFSWFCPCPRRRSTAFRSCVIGRRSRRCIFRSRYERFIFRGWLEATIPILKITRNDWKDLIRTHRKFSYVTRVGRRNFFLSSRWWWRWRCCNVHGTLKNI